MIVTRHVTIFALKYWALKKELDRLDGGEDDSDVVQSWADDQISGVDDSDMMDDISTNWDDDLNSS
jgi:hypothetical protein